MHAITFESTSNQSNDVPFAEASGRGLAMELDEVRPTRMPEHVLSMRYIVNSQAPG
jgi:hypothetical protein